jgi:hypothetical protein
MLELTKISQASGGAAECDAPRFAWGDDRWGSAEAAAKEHRQQRLSVGSMPLSDVSTAKKFNKITIDISSSATSSGAASKSISIQLPRKKVVGTDYTHLGIDEVNKRLVECVVSILQRRGGSCPMCDLCNEESLIRDLALSQRRLVGASERKGYILEAIREQAKNIEVTYENGRCNPTIQLP